MFYLRRETRGARRRPRARGGAERRRGDLRAGRARSPASRSWSPWPACSSPATPCSRRSRSARSSSSPSPSSARSPCCPRCSSKLGDRVEKGRVPFIAKRRHRNQRRVARLGRDPRPRARARVVVRRRSPAALLLVLALPALDMHTINTGVQGLPRDLPIMQTYDRIQAAFPGGPLPAVVAVQADDVTAPAVAAGHRRPRAGGARHGRDVRARSTSTVNPDKTVAVVHIPLDGDGHRRRVERRARRRCATRSSRRRSGGRRRRGRRHRHHRRLEGLQRHDEVAPAARVRASCSGSRSCCCW